MVAFRETRAAIDAVATATPEQKFSATLVADAAERAKSGDWESYAWLWLCGRRWIVAFVGEHSCDDVLKRLLDGIPELPAPVIEQARELPEVASIDGPGVVKLMVQIEFGAGDKV